VLTCAQFSAPCFAPQACDALARELGEAPTGGSGGGGGEAGAFGPAEIGGDASEPEDNHSSSLSDLNDGPSGLGSAAVILPRPFPDEAPPAARPRLALPPPRAE